MSVKSVHISRYIKATPQEVFDAWTQPEWLEKWWCTAGYRFERIDIDLQPFGSFRYELVPEAGQAGPTCVMEGQFREVQAPERIASTWTISAADFIEADTKLQVTFRPEGEGTEVTVFHEGFATEEGYQLHETDWDLVLAKLNQVFEARTAAV